MVSQTKTTQRVVNGLFGTLEATRTPDLRLRRQLLYPTELRGHVSCGKPLNNHRAICLPISSYL